LFTFVFRVFWSGNRITFSFTC